ncbi:hypothetical protein [Flavobacterium sp. SM2513]|uniref:hypothetical protein n=1 Tax=Flavobacterium sp. SM2513 TaxID=3424766 RepID=UPI003D7FEBC2
MKNIVNAFIILFFFNSCSKEEIHEPKGDGIPYYQFTEVEKSKLISQLNVDDEIVYKNQDNEVLKYKIYWSHIKKNTASSNGFLGYSTKYFHYDEQRVYMNVEGTGIDCDITILKYPIGANYDIENPTVGIPKFYGYFTFSLWNGYKGTDTYNNHISVNFDLPTSSMVT